MPVYLFIYAITAGSLTGPQSQSTYHNPIWKGQWQYATKFDQPNYCHQAAANLGLKKEEYRCIDIKGGVQ